jgi:ABC-2 type transport system permease protein
LLAVAGGAAPLMAVLGAIGLTGEFRHRTATATFLTTPHRGRVVAAKLITYAAAGLGYAIIGVAVTLAISLPWLANRGIQWNLSAGAIAATVAGGLAAMATFGLLGAGLGALLREQVATVVGVLIYLFIVEKIVTGVHALARGTIYLPGPDQEAVVGSTLTNQPLLAPWQGGLVLAGYGLAAAAAGTRTAMRRDVT